MLTDNLHESRSHVIHESVGNRPLYPPLLIGDKTVLLDTGCSLHPTEVSQPRLALAAQLDFTANTHADLDHCGR